MEDAIRLAVRAQRVADPAAEEQFVRSACVLLGALMQAGPAEAAPDAAEVVRGLARLTALLGVQPTDAARLALASPELLSAPPQRLVETMMMLRRVFPDADLSRVADQMPAVLLCDTFALEMSARGALQELQLLGLPPPIVTLLAQEEPSLFFGALDVVRLEQLGEAWHDSGMAALSAEELARDMRNDRWLQYFRNRFVCY